MIYLFFNLIFFKFVYEKKYYIDGDWGLGPIPNPQSPKNFKINLIIHLNLINILININYK